MSSGSSTAKTAVDTVYLYGGPDTWEGKFETGTGPDWQGWTHRDLNEAIENHWHISPYYAANLAGHGPGNLAMYCGDPDLPACSPQDSVGGVASSMFDNLFWNQVVGNPGQPLEMQLTASMNYDVADAGWDFVEIWLGQGAQARMLADWTGSEDNLYVDISTTVDPEELSGISGDELVLTWRVWSDGGWDDEDCLVPSHGACQIDDISVRIDGQLITFDDFEVGSEVHWSVGESPVVGDFSALRQGLQDLDPCRNNNSWQVSFIDDGIVVPGTGGTPCISWCYGPGGWILNNTGGLLANDSVPWFLENQVESPPIAWQEGLEGAILSFDVYVHETLCSNCPGIFYLWHVRSTSSSDPADLENAPWENRPFVHYGGPEYRTHVEPVSDLLVPDRQWVQIALEVNELGWVWGWNGLDGTPAPYFDNVSLRAWEPQGPEFMISPDMVFIDAYPEAGQLNPDQLAANSCRVDPVIDLNRNNLVAGVVVRGDSLVAQVTALRRGAQVSQAPRIHWVLDCNPLFDTVREQSPDAEGRLRGSLPGTMVYPDSWAFDLPDTGWFFPGDILHYYLTASDDLDGDIRLAVWPADTTSVMDFSPYSQYPEEALVRALPGLTSGPGSTFVQPDMLVCDDGRSAHHTNRLNQILRERGFVAGVDYDLLHVEGANYFYHNQMLATVPTAVLNDYQTFFYSSGHHTSGTLRGDSANFPDDDELLLNWLGNPDRRALLMGSGLASDLIQGSAYGSLSGLLGLAYQGANIEELIGADQALQVTPVPGNGVFPDNVSYSLRTDCLPSRKPDAILPTGGGSAPAHLGIPGSSGGVYSAAVTRVDPVLNHRTAIAPIDLVTIMSPAEGYPDGLPLSGRARFAGALLDWLGAYGSGVSPVPETLAFSVEAYPNPFNPQITIGFTMPKAGHLSLKIFDVRGHLVRTVFNGQQEAGPGRQVWDGRDSEGAAVPSGVYFYQARGAETTKVGKLTLLK